MNMRLFLSEVTSELESKWRQAGGKQERRFMQQG